MSDFVIVDDRDIELAMILDSMIPIKIERLNIADVVISFDVAIERKRYDDFSSSIKDGRIFDQVNNMQAYKYKIFIYEGEEPVQGYNIYDKSVLGTLAHLIINGDVSIIHTKDIQDTAYIIKSLFEKQGKGLEINPINKEKLPDKLFEQQMFLVSSLPHLGKNTVDIILKIFKTPKAFFEEIFNVKYIYGPRSKKIKGYEGKLNEIPNFGLKTLQDCKNILENIDNKFFV